MSGLVFEQIPISRAAVIGRVAIDLVVVFVARAGAEAGAAALGGEAISDRTAADGSVARNGRGRVGDSRPPGRCGRPELSRGVPGGRCGSRPPPQRPHHFPGPIDGLLPRVHTRVGSRSRTAASGFTWYPRSVSSGENSIAGVHGMLGGYDYTVVQMDKRGKPLRDLSTEAFSILPYNFSHKGYHVNMVRSQGPGIHHGGRLQVPGHAERHLRAIPAVSAERRARQMGFPLNDLSKASYVNLLVLLGAVRAAPYIDQGDAAVAGLLADRSGSLGGNDIPEWANCEAFPQLSDTHAAESNFNFVDNMLPHESYYMGEDCRPRASSSPRDGGGGPDAAGRQACSRCNIRSGRAARCSPLRTTWISSSPRASTATPGSSSSPITGSWGRSEAIRRARSPVEPWTMSTSEPAPCCW